MTLPHMFVCRVDILFRPEIYFKPPFPISSLSKISKKSISWENSHLPKLLLKINPSLDQTLSSGLEEDITISALKKYTRIISVGAF